MSAVDTLLANIKSFDAALDAASSGKLCTDTERMVLRGVAVQSLSVFEDFLLSRAKEWSASITMKRLPPSSLPGGADAANEWRARIVDRLPRRFRNADSDSQRALLFAEIADSLKSFNQQTVVAHDIFFDWPGSNVQESDIEKAMALLGVKDAWSELTQLRQRLDPTLPRHLSAKSLFTDVKDNRHLAAHDPNYHLSYISVAAGVRNLKQIAMLVDCLGSVATGRILLMQTQSNQPVFQAVKARALRRDGSLWREYTTLSQSVRAFRRHSDFITGMAESGTRLTHPYDVLIAFDGSDIVEWKTAT